MADRWPRQVAVVGGGTMGLGFAELLSGAGLAVRLCDASPELTRESLRRLERRVGGHVEAGLLEEEALERAATVEGADDVAATVRGSELVIEAVPERLELKLETLPAIEAAAEAETVITSNTSSYSIDELATAIERRERFVGVHWFNPPEWVPGVEVIPAEGTDPGVVERVMELLRRLGKRPAIVGDSAAFVANRLQSALLREALACVREGLCEPAGLDEVVRSSFGFRLPFFGPFQIADMAGLDTQLSVFETLEDGLGERFEAGEAVRDVSAVVDEGRTGTKSGGGFFDYTDEERERLLIERDRRYAALAELLERLAPL
jgi:3-hydroxybutyryl-CoA dehydrogenase